MEGKKCSSLVILTLLMLVGCYHTVIGKVTVLSSFEEQTVFNQRWQIYRPTDLDLTISDSFSTHGSRSLHMSVNVSNDWPSITWSTGRGLLRDWTEYTQVFFDYYNPTSIDIQLYFRIVDDNTQKTLNYYVPPGEGAVSASLGDMGLDLSKIKEIKFYFSQPQVPMELYIDNFSLAALPNVPRNITAQRIENSNQVKISWQEAKQSDDDTLEAIGYLVYRKGDPDPNNFVLIGQTSDNYWVDPYTDYDDRLTYTLFSDYGACAHN